MAAAFIAAKLKKGTETSKNARQFPREGVARRAGNAFAG